MTKSGSLSEQPGIAGLGADGPSDKTGRLVESGRSFQILVQSVTDYAIYMLDAEGRVASWNAGAERIKGYSEREILGQHFSRFYTQEDRKAQAPKRALATALRDGKFEKEGCWRLRKDGTAFWASVIIQPVRDEMGTLIGFAKITRDISSRMLAEANLRAAHERFASVFRHASVGLVQVDAKLRFILVNDAFCKIIGRPREAVLQMSVSDILAPHERGSDEILLNLVRSQHRGVVVERRYVRPDGSLVDCRVSVSLAPDGTGQPANPLVAIGVFEDITERKKAEARISHLAFHDGLTGLANRALLNDRLAHILRQARPEDTKQCAILSLDLDRFKAINETLGHGAGDSLLRLVASRLGALVRTIDTVARFGSDEFVILQVDAMQPTAATRLAEQVVEVMAEPFEIEGGTVFVGASVGIALRLSPGQTEADLLKNADAALERAKADGGGAFRFFDADMDSHMRERRALESDLRAAIGTDQLCLAYQPQFASWSGALLGFEVLLRWRHPVRGNVSPADFIPIAEETRLIVQIGLWVLEQATREAASWSQPLRLAVNLSPVQFRGGELAAQVAAILDRTGLPPARLDIELTETLLVEDHAQAASTLRALKDLGVNIALDDFGTGYSSLSYLRQFPFDKIKIDQSFVQALGREPSAVSIVQAIVAMGNSLGMRVIAEGVETDEQLQMLRELGCQEIQGFLLGRPVPATGMARYLAGGHTVSSDAVTGNARGAH